MAVDSSSQRPLDALVFDNRFTDELPADPSTAVRPRPVQGASYSLVAPTPVAGPSTVAYSREMLAELGLDESVGDSDDFAQVFSGNRLLDGMEPFAMAYGGHQFGNWAGQLGDGRAIALGEVVTPDGGHLTLQLKGAGLTPYSRTADGLAVLRSSVREFLCSEAMHHLGVPTTRALSLVTTGETVVRDMLYDGNPQPELGAIVCRIAPSFVRFGSFQLPASRGDLDLLRQLVDFTIRNDFPHLGDPSPETYAAFFHEVNQRTAEMVVEWMRVGFVHGVMNTDNMSILGLTIDYGPYGWLDDFDPDWTPNTTDAGQQRYRFGWQPQVAHWNLAQLGNALVPLVGQDNVEGLQAALESYEQTYQRGLDAMMASKLGLVRHEGEADTGLISDLYQVLRAAETDMTIFYRRLAEVPTEAGGHEPTDEELFAPLLDAYYVPAELTPEVRTQILGWLHRYRDRVQADGTTDADRRETMSKVNPKYVLRNYLAQLAIDKAEDGDNSLVVELLEVLRRPYDEQPESEEFAAKRPDWARTRVGCSQLSCSS